MGNPSGELGSDIAGGIAEQFNQGGTEGPALFKDITSPLATDSDLGLASKIAAGNPGAQPHSIMLDTAGGNLTGDVPDFSESKDPFAKAAGNSEAVGEIAKPVEDPFKGMTDAELDDAIVKNGNDMMVSGRDPDARSEQEARISERNKRVTEKETTELTNLKEQNSNGAIIAGSPEAKRLRELTAKHPTRRRDDSLPTDGDPKQATFGIDGDNNLTSTSAVEPTQNFAEVSPADALVQPATPLEGQASLATVASSSNEASAQIQPAVQAATETLDGTSVAAPAAQAQLEGPRSAGTVAAEVAEVAQLPAAAVEADDAGQIPTSSAVTSESVTPTKIGDASNTTLGREADAAIEYAFGQPKATSAETVVIDQEQDDATASSEPPLGPRLDADPADSTTQPRKTGDIYQPPTKDENGDDIQEGEFREIDDEPATKQLNSPEASTPNATADTTTQARESAVDDTTGQTEDSTNDADSEITIATPVAGMSTDEIEAEHDELANKIGKTPEDYARLKELQDGWEQKNAETPPITMTNDEINAAMPKMEAPGPAKEVTIEPPPGTVETPQQKVDRLTAKYNNGDMSVAGELADAKTAVSEQNELNTLRGMKAEDMTPDQIKKRAELEEKFKEKTPTNAEAPKAGEENLTKEQIAQKRDKEIEDLGTKMMMKMINGEMPTDEELDNLQKLLSEKDMAGKGFSEEDARKAIKMAQESQRGKREKGFRETEEAKTKTIELMSLQHELQLIVGRMETLSKDRDTAQKEAYNAHDEAERATPSERMKKKAMEYSATMKALNFQGAIEGMHFAAQKIDARRKDLEQFVRRKAGITGPIQAVFEWSGAKMNNTMTSIAILAENKVPMVGSLGGRYQRRQLAGSGRA